MQRIIFLVAAATLLLYGGQNINAQETRVNWNEIDSVTVYQPLHASQFKTLYILPIDDSKADYFSDESAKTMQKVAESRAEFGQVIRETIMKAYKNLDVQLVDAKPAVGPEDLVLSIVFTEYNLGNAALRGWVGGGNAGFTLEACFSGANDEKFVDITHRHKSGLLDPNKYEKIIRKYNGVFADDFVTALKALEAE